jgi:alpha-1,3/alpha-1,6-mannosyltransferase
MTSDGTRRSLRIAFLHPDLGIGGAERLVIDAACALARRGHAVTIFTAHLDPRRCFEEARDGTIDLEVRGAFLPLHIAERLRAPCAIARMGYLAGRLRLARERFDVVFCDLVSHAIPVLKWGGRSRVIFYCHFPDLLLTPQRAPWYRLYRAPIDWWEQKTTGMADRILVNSEYTATMFRRVFPRLASRALDVVRPGTRLDAAITPERGPSPSRGLILCVGRFETRKNLPLAVEAFARLGERLGPDRFGALRLVIAGGYDERLRDHRETLKLLRARVREFGLERQVTLRLSPDDAERAALLSQSACVIYPPAGEHFGYVPIEAMAAGRPVVAADSGGPAETIRDGETGFLRPPAAPAFAAALECLVRSPELVSRMGAAGRAHVAARFSLESFGARLDAIARAAVPPPGGTR